MFDLAAAPSELNTETELYTGQDATLTMSTGPHLQFEARRHGTAIDPRTLLPG